MKSMAVLGMVLVLAGVLFLVFQGFSYTRQEKVLDVGPIHATRETQKRVALSPIIGGLVLVSGVFLLLLGTRQSHG